MEIFYHGSSVLFDRFDLSHAMEGDGKVKYGYGVYVTQAYKTAAHYSGCGRGTTADTHYVYTIEVPEMTADNHIWSNAPVCEVIISRASEKLGEIIPAEVCAKGKMFRKYIGNRLTGMKGTWKKLSSIKSLESEKAATAFLLSIGVEILVWPVDQKKPDGKQHRAILDDRKVKIVKIEQVELDKKVQLIEGSSVEIIR